MQDLGVHVEQIVHNNLIHYNNPRTLLTKAIQFDFNFQLLKGASTSTASQVIADDILIAGCD